MIQVLGWLKERLKKMLVGKFPYTLIHFTDPPPKPVKLPMPEIPRSLSDIDPEINTDFKESVISEMYQRPDKSYFQEPQKLESQINTDRLVQKFLPKQADIDKILKIMQRNVLKGRH